MDSSPLSPLFSQENSSSTVFNTVEKIIEGMSSSDEHVLLAATCAVVKTLSREINSLSENIDIMIASGIVTRCVDILSHFHNPSLQNRVARILTNVASGTHEQTKAVIDAGAVPRLVKLLSSSEMHVAEQAVWALGNIAGDGPGPRDLVLSSDAMPALLELVKPDIYVSLLKIIVWTISNLCRCYNRPPPLQKVKICLSVLGRLLYHNDIYVLVDTCWALSYLTEGSSDKIQWVLDTGVVPKLVELLGSSEHMVLIPTIRAVGNIVAGNDNQTDAIIQAGGLEYLRVLLGHENANIMREAAWTVSNITAGNDAQIQAVIDCDVLQPLGHVLAGGHFRSQREAAWAITNFTSRGSDEQIVTLIKLGVLEPFCNVLDSKDCSTVLVVLIGILNILKTAVNIRQAEEVAIIIEEYNTLDKLERLQSHENETIYLKTWEIISLWNSFFAGGSEESRRPIRFFSS